jgi:hypothetical protein
VFSLPSTRLEALSICLKTQLMQKQHLNNININIKAENVYWRGRKDTGSEAITFFMRSIRHLHHFAHSFLQSVAVHSFKFIFTSVSVLVQSKYEVFKR